MVYAAKYDGKRDEGVKQVTRPQGLRRGNLGIEGPRVASVALAAIDAVAVGLEM